MTSATSSDGRRAAGGGEAAGNRAEEDGKEGCRLDQGVACRQFVAIEALRQEAVFDRGEKGGEHAEEEEGEEEDRDRLEDEPGNGDACRPDLPVFDRLGKARLVDAGRQARRLDRRAGEKAG